MVKIKMLLICCGLSLVVGIGGTIGIGAGIIGGIISERDKNYQLAEDRINTLKSGIIASQKRVEELESSLVEVGNQVTGITSRVGNVLSRSELALDYNRQLKKILQSAKTME